MNLSKQESTRAFQLVILDSPLRDTLDFSIFFTTTNSESLNSPNNSPNKRDLFAMKSVEISWNSLGQARKRFRIRKKTAQNLYRSKRFESREVKKLSCIQCVCATHRTKIERAFAEFSNSNCIKVTVHLSRSTTASELFGCAEKNYYCCLPKKVQKLISFFLSCCELRRPLFRRLLSFFLR